MATKRKVSFGEWLPGKPPAGIITGADIRVIPRERPKAPKPGTLIYYNERLEIWTGDRWIPAVKE